MLTHDFYLHFFRKNNDSFFDNLMDLNGEPVGDSLVPYDAVPLRSSRVQPAISSEELGIVIELEGKERAEDGGKT